MARFKAVALRNVTRWRAAGEGYMQANEHGGFVYLPDYNRAVRKAVEEQRAAAAASKLVGELYRLIQDLGSSKLEDEARKLLRKNNCLTRGKH